MHHHWENDDCKYDGDLELDPLSSSVPLLALTLEEINARNLLSFRFLLTNITSREHGCSRVRMSDFYVANT